MKLRKKIIHVTIHKYYETRYRDDPVTHGTGRENKIRFNLGHKIEVIYEGGERESFANIPIDVKHHGLGVIERDV